jgi:pyruvate kinase
MMIRKCCLAGKPSVIATQMLESMITNPRPTRAEVSDVANAIYDSTSAVMLSGETAIGAYPVQTVKVMRSIIHETEKDFAYRDFFYHDAKRVYHDVPSSVTLATVKTAYSANAKAIFAFTSSGLTARLLSRLRPEMPIIAMTPNEKKYHQLAFNWGVVPLWSDSHSIEQAFAKLSEYALAHGHVAYGDLVVVTSGTPFGVVGTTNTMMVESIGDVLVRGHFGHGKVVYGKVTIVLSPEGKKEYDMKERLVVIPRCDDSFLPLLKNAAGVILQNNVDDVDSERYLVLVAKALDLPIIVRADSALFLLKEGQLATLDPAKALVYKGIVN